MATLINEVKLGAAKGTAVEEAVDANFKGETSEVGLYLAMARQALDRLGIDETGLDEMDRRILTCLVKTFGGGPVGVESLAVALHETSRTIEEVYEPYLIKEGFLQRGQRGRIALERAYSYLGVKPPLKEKASQQPLF